MESGIKQGCPLSPLLFVTVVDMLLRRITDEIPEATPRAFADDIALTLLNFGDRVNSLQSLFNGFSQISGLYLNLPKTVIIPLWPIDLQQLKSSVSCTCPEWSEVSFADCGKYLGFFTGPGKGDKSWDKPIDKYVKAAQQWCEQALGLQYTTVAYNTFAMSILSFVCQLERPPTHLLNTEREVLRKVAVGPGEWAIPEDLWFLRENFSQARSFRCVEILSLASQVRVAKQENASRGGLQVLTRARELQHLLSGTDYMDRRYVWQSWYANSHVRILASAIHTFEASVTSISALEGAPQPGNNNFRLQSAASKAIVESRKPQAEDRVRHKLARWNLEGYPGRNARRVLRRLQELQCLVPPRVSSACFSTVWNRWTTARRFQQRQSTTNRCVLGCSCSAEDSIEHYMHCRIIHEFARSRLRLERLDPYALLMASDDMQWNDAGRLTRLAILVYCAYRATQTARNQPQVDEAVAKQMLGHMLKEAVRDHAASARVLREVWSD